MGYGKFNTGSIELDANLYDEYGMDSVDLVGIITDIECEFDFTIDSDKLTNDNFSTARMVLDYVVSKLSVE